jgi:hypothetical protein
MRFDIMDLLGSEERGTGYTLSRLTHPNDLGQKVHNQGG